MRRPLTVLAVSHTGVVPEYRARYRHLASTGELRVHLLCPRRWPQYRSWLRSPPGDPEASGVEVIRRQPWVLVPLGQGARNVSHVYPGLEALVRELAPDLLECWNEPYSLLAWQCLGALRRGAPRAGLVVTSAQNLPKRYPFPFGWMERRVLRSARLALPVNRAAGERLRSRGYRGPMEVLPLGVDTARFLPPEGTRAAGPLRVGFVGKLDHQKGVDLLLEAAARVGEGIELSVVGTGPEEAALRRRARDLGLGEGAFVGALPHRRMPEHLRGLDVVVMPSRRLPGLEEQFGRVLVEGMATGLLVLGADTGEVPEVLGDPGLVFPEEDVEELARRLRRARDEPAWRREAGERLRARALREYGWDRVAARQRRLYLQVTGRS